MEPKFKIGDVVVLKSGGPVMTINKEIPTIDSRLNRIFSGAYECIWFIGDNSNSGTFHQDALELKPSK